MRKTSLLAGLFLIVLTATGQAEEAKPFLTNTDVDLTAILPSPPANDRPRPRPKSPRC